MTSMVPNIYRKPAASGSARSIGAILVDNGRLSMEHAEQILRRQKEQGKRFGDAAIEIGLLSEDDIRFALASQFDHPYMPVGDDSLSQELVAAYQPMSPVVEQLRALRSQLMLRWFDGESARKALAIVSPGHGEGRSFIAANLAIVFSQLGERTLLIDADMRTPRQHELFKLGNHTGLSAMLAGRIGSDAVVRVASMRGLSVLPAGAEPPNPQELLGRSAFFKLLMDFGDEYDVIIIDTPAAGIYADAQTVAARAGAALMLARKNRSSVPAIAELSQRLQQSGATLVGSVLNDG